MKDAWLHFKKICTHRKWVRHYCKLAGIPLQGWLHDLSKYSPAEFIESVQFYQGTSSPINAAKQAQGYSMAWLHHKGRNKHHYEYWMDNFDNGGENLIMPYKYWVEMICDYLGAARAYNAKEFSFHAEEEWWKNKVPNCAMNEKLKKATSRVFVALSKQENAYSFDFWVSPEQLLTKKDECFILRQIYNEEVLMRKY